jgi:hypothetical protein
MIDNKSSEMKSVYSRTETTVSDSVLKCDDPQYLAQFSEAEKIDEMRVIVMDMMSDAISDFLEREGKVNQYTYVAELRRMGGIVGLARELDEISSRLHLECAWLKKYDFQDFIVN